MDQQNKFGNWTGNGRKQKANWFLMSWPWDHKIKMKEGFEPKSFKNYSLTPQEQIEMEKFLSENLEKEYIQPSKSPMTSPFFFVDKKDGKLQPTQDYCYLNEWTIKNASSFNLQYHQQTSRISILYQTQYPVGIQQCPNQRRWWMEGCIQNQQRTLQTNSNVLWNV